MRQHPIHKDWLEAQAQAAEYRRLTAELNAYANPYRGQALIPRQPQPVSKPTAARRFSTKERKPS